MRRRPSLRRAERREQLLILRLLRFGGVPSECGGTAKPTYEETGYECGLAPDGCPTGPICTEQPEVCEELHPSATCAGPLSEFISWVRPEVTPTRPTRYLNAPGAELRVLNAAAYIAREPEAALHALSEGVVVDASGASCERCENQNADLAPLLAGAVTDYGGRFTLEGDIPVDRGEARVGARLGIDAIPARRAPALPREGYHS